MDDNITSILLVSLAAVILLGAVVYSIYRNIQTNRLRKRLEDEAWQRHIGLPPLTTRGAKYVGAIHNGNYYSNAKKHTKNN